MTRRHFWIFMVLAAVAVVSATIPQVQKARREEQLRACRSNLKNLGTALEMYSTDASGRYPRDEGLQSGLALLTPDYLKVIPTCPAAGKDTYSESYSMAN